VPNVEGWTLRNARVRLARRDCRLGHVTRTARRGRKGKRVVVRQSPSAGKVRPNGARVSVRLGFRRS
jgi:beta-lactam-binding protein with PASTA domain